MPNEKVRFFKSVDEIKEKIVYVKDRDMIVQIMLHFHLIYIEWKNLEFQKISFIWMMIIFMVNH